MEKTPLLFQMIQIYILCDYSVMMFILNTASDVVNALFHAMAN
jgi:hypothetical protein